MEIDQYTRIQMLTTYFSSKKYIFLVEVETLKVKSENEVQYSVVVSGILHIRPLLLGLS